MTVQLTHDLYLRTVDDVRRAADRLRAQRDRADRQVDVLLDGGWAGRAAHGYRDGWEEWRAGAGEVLRGLEAMADLLVAVRDDLVVQDEASQDRLDAISQRILARLS